jgi:hypothetical protein
MAGGPSEGLSTTKTPYFGAVVAQKCGKIVELFFDLRKIG